MTPEERPAPVPPPMLALTVWQPWAYCICHESKDVENRTWTPPLRVLGTRIAIHAGKAFDADAVARLVAAGMLRRGAIHGAPLGAIVCTVRLYLWTRSARSRWAEPGMKHWLLDDVRLLRKPVVVRGAQGLWTVPPEIAARVRELELRCTDALTSPGGRRA